MSKDRQDAIANANRTTPEQEKKIAAHVARRAGQEVVRTLRLYDADPLEYRDLLIASFDAEVKSCA